MDEKLLTSDSFSVVTPSSGRVASQLRRKHHQIIWSHPRTAGSGPGASAESASISDAVTASWGTSAAASDALSVSDFESYPSAAQIMYRGRNAAIWWRQPETPPGGLNNLSDSLAESMAAPVDALSSRADLQDSMIEPLTAVDHYGGVHPDRRPPPGGKKHDDDDFEELGLIIGLMGTIIKR